MTKKKKKLKIKRIKKRKNGMSVFKKLLLLVVGVPILVPGIFAAKSFYDSDFFKTVKLKNEMLEKIDNKGEVITLPKIKSIKKYDPTVWTSIISIHMSPKKNERIILMYNLDIEGKDVRELLGRGLEFKCMNLKPKDKIKSRKVCVPLKYIHHKEQFYASNSVINQVARVYKFFVVNTIAAVSEL